MPSIDVTINFAYSNLLSGRVTATPKESFVNSANKIVQGGIAFPSVTITNGAASIVLPSTQDFGIAYTFVLESGVSPNFTKIDTFDAVIPNTTPIAATQLLTTYFALDLLDTSVAMISDIITKDPYLTRISQRISGFSNKPYSAGQIFVKNDLTYRGGRYYQWISNTQGNVDPLTAGNYTDPGNYLDGTTNVNAPWMVATGDLRGAGTTTNSLVYDQSSFEALNSNPASRKNLNELRANILAAVSTPDLSAYARKDSQNSFSQLQTFGAGAAVSDLATNDNSSAVPNTRTVRAIINALGTGFSLMNRISVVAERYPAGTNCGLSTGNNTRQLNAYVLNSGDIVSFTTPNPRLKAGTYLIFATAIANRTNGSRLLLLNASDNSTLIESSGLSGFTGSNLGDTSSANTEISFLEPLTLSNDTSLALRHWVGTGAGDAGGRASNRSGQQETFSRMMMFRLS